MGNAGAEVIITNTYACTPEILGKRGLGDRLEELIETGCNLAHQAREQSGTATLVAGSMPPISVTYRPDLSPDETVLRKTYTRIAAALAPNVDLFIIETVSSILEARVAASVAKSFGKPVWVACTLAQPTQKENSKPVHENSNTRGTKRVQSANKMGDAASMLGKIENTNTVSQLNQLTVALRSGESISDYAAALDEYADALLFNCSTPEATSIAISELRAAAPHKACGAYANHFQPVPLDWVLDADEEGGGLLTIRGDLTPETYGRYASHWKDLGATIIGGCCGITPSHITHLATHLAPAKQQTATDETVTSECIFEVVQDMSVLTTVQAR